MTTRATDMEPTAIAALVSGVTIHVTCECGEQFCHEIECEEDDFGGWSASPEDRFILCDTCKGLIDAGLYISVGSPD